MSSNIDSLFERNSLWAASVKAEQPTYFDRLTELQDPEYLWIGCSDSRVPANQISGLLPGEVFVHRNIANLVVHSDQNCLSVIQYAVDVLKVRHILVTGHYGCSGIQAAAEEQRHGLVDNWLRHILDQQEKHRALFDKISDREKCRRKMCEINVIEQVFSACQTTIVRDAWERGQCLTVHGLVFDIADGILRTLNVSSSSHEQAQECYGAAISRVYSENKDFELQKSEPA